MSLTKVSYSMIAGAPVNVEDYGAVGDDPTFDSWAAITAAIATNRKVVFQGKTYYISKPLESEYYNLEGAGWGSSLTPSTAKTVIKKTTHALGTHASVNGVSFAVDSVISVVFPAGSYSNGWAINGISFQGISDVDRNAYVMYAPKVAQFSMNTVGMAFGTNGIYSTAMWDCLLSHVQVSNSNVGWNIVNGDGSTSWVANACSTVFCGIGFQFFNLQYSVFNSCYAESTSTIAWSFQSSSNIVLNGGGGENPTGAVLNLNTARVTLIGWQTGQITGINGVSAVSVNDSELTIIGSTLQDFSTVNGAKIMTVTGVGSPSTVKVFNSILPTNGAATTVDGYSTLLNDSFANRETMRGFTDVEFVYSRNLTDTTTAVFFTNGVFSTVGTPTYRFKQINNVVYFNIYVSCTVSGAGAGTIIFDTPFNAASATSVSGSAFIGDVAGRPYSSSTSRVRVDFVAPAGATTVYVNGQINLS